MRLRTAEIAIALVCLSVPAARGADYTLETSDAPPQEVPEAIARQLQTEGVRVVGPRRALCEIWLLKDLAITPGFSPSLAVKYPLTPGQLVGAMRVPRRSGLKDFRGQEIDAGVYTLRYGQQPMDGNHIGTSDTADFLLAVPVSADADPAPIADVKELFSKSAAAAGTTHPAIFSLLPAEAAEGAAPGLVHDAEREFWIVELIAQGGDQKLPLRLVVVGESKG